MNKPRSIFTGLLLIITGATVGAFAQDVLPPSDAPGTEYHPTARVYFSPAKDAASSPTAAIIREVDAAKKIIRVQAYSFTSPPIIEALVRAKARGVDVWVLLDKSNATAKYSGARAVIEAGIPTGIDRQHAIAHNKIMVIDSETVITGSFNFTRSAEEKNAENLLILKDPALAAQYRAYGREHGQHSDRISEADIRSKGTSARENRENAAPDDIPDEPQATPDDTGAAKPRRPAADIVGTWKGVESGMLFEFSPNGEARITNENRIPGPGFIQKGVRYGTYRFGTVPGGYALDFQDDKTPTEKVRLLVQFETNRLIVTFTPGTFKETFKRQGAAPQAE